MRKRIEQTIVDKAIDTITGFRIVNGLLNTISKFIIVNFRNTLKQYNSTGSIAFIL